MKKVMSMSKTILILATLLAAVALPARADFSTATFTTGFPTTVPDGSTVGLMDARTLTGIPFNTIQDVNVRINLSGGWNGDLYAYLVHNSGFSVLLNRVGRSLAEGTSFGYSDAGMNVTFDDQSTHTRDFHFYRSEGGFTTAMLTGGEAWKPDGRNINPTSMPTTYDSTSPTALLSSFNGLDPNGSWTLFIADLSAGSQSTINSWGLDIVGINVAAVAEPASIIEGSLAALFLGALVSIYRIRKPQAEPLPA